jgi:hypothetical protein
MWVYIAPNVPVMEIKYATPFEACFIIHDIWLPKKGSSTLFEKSASFKNGTDTATINGEPATLFCMSHVLQLIFNEC